MTSTSVLTTGTQQDFAMLNPASLFINMSKDIQSFDHSSRTRVRVQVMRDYHQRRRTLKTQPEGVHSITRPLATGKKLKFRLGKEKALKPWVAVKAIPKAKTSKKIVAMEEKEKSPEQPSVQGILPPDHSTKLTIAASPAIELLDPFNTTISPITPKIQLLLHHYFSFRAPSSLLMLPMRLSIFQHALQDLAFFHTALCHYSTSFTMTYPSYSHASPNQGGNEMSPHFHNSTAARIISTRLGTASALSDSTIGAVANITAFESSNGSNSSMIIHMDGLERMVILRGGIEHGGFGALVRRQLVWADYHVATALLTKPRFERVDLLDGEGEGIWDLGMEGLLREVGGMVEVLKGLRSCAGDGQGDIRWADRIYVLQRGLFDFAYGDIENLQATSSCWDNEDQNEPVPAISDSLDMTESGEREPASLSSWDIEQQSQHNQAFPDLLVIEEQSERDINRLCALTALMYTGHCLRDIPLTYAVFKNGVSRLKTAVEESQLSSVSTVPAENGLESSRWDTLGVGVDIDHRNWNVFWVVMFGAVAAEGKSQREWFVGRVERCVRDLGVSCWGDAKTVLEGVLWQDELDLKGMRVWDEMRYVSGGGQWSSE